MAAPVLSSLRSSAFLEARELPCEASTDPPGSWGASVCSSVIGSTFDGCQSSVSLILVSEKMSLFLVNDVCRIIRQSHSPIRPSRPEKKKKKDAHTWNRTRVTKATIWCTATVLCEPLDLAHRHSYISSPQKGGVGTGRRSVCPPPSYLIFLKKSRHPPPQKGGGATTSPPL